MSLSTDPGYLARHGIRARGGPRDGQIVADNQAPHRSLLYFESGFRWEPGAARAPIGVYDLRGLPEGGFEYVWDGDYPARARRNDEWQRDQNRAMMKRTPGLKILNA